MPGPRKPAAPQVGEVLAVAEDAVGTPSASGLVGRHAAMQLVEGALADDADDRDVWRRAEPFVQIEVGEPATRHREALVEPAYLLELCARDEHAVALPHAVEPVTSADEVADLEEPVAGSGPADATEQPVLVRLVVTVAHGVGLLARPDVPLLSRHDGGGVGLQSLEPEVQHARRQNVRAVDHQHEVLAAAFLDADVEGVRG